MLEMWSGHDRRVRQHMAQEQVWRPYILNDVRMLELSDNYARHIQRNQGGV